MKLLPISFIADCRLPIADLKKRQHENPNWQSAIGNRQCFYVAA